MRHSLAGATLFALLVQGCIGGQVVAVDANGVRRALSGVTVTIDTCSDFELNPSTGGCTTITATTDSTGYYFYDAYASGSLITRLPGLDFDSYQIRVTSLPPDYHGAPVGVVHKPSFQVYPSTGEYYTLAPIIYVTPTSDSTDADTDGDGLTDAIENRVFNTDPGNPDTDGDGLADSSEVYGVAWAPLPDWGADPLRKQYFVEVDAGKSMNRAGFPSATFANAVRDYYDDIPVDNPDGSQGIDVIMIYDRLISRAAYSESNTFANLANQPGDFGNDFCPVSDLAVAVLAQAPGNPNRQSEWLGVTHYAQICPCPQDGNGGFCNAGGIAEFPSPATEVGGGNMLWLAPWTTTSSDDMTEPVGGFFPQMIAHEMGHTMGLTHAGGDEGLRDNFGGVPSFGSTDGCGEPQYEQDIAYKINYPSIMSYAYREGLTEHPGGPVFSSRPLQDWITVGWSDGDLPDIDERCLSEAEPWYTGGPFPSEILRYNNFSEYEPLSSTGITGWDDGELRVWVDASTGGYVVDWNQNGVRDMWFDGSHYQPKRGLGTVLIKPMISRDYDDIAHLAHGIAAGMGVQANMLDPQFGYYMRAPIRPQLSQDTIPGFIPPSADYYSVLDAGPTYYELSCPGEINRNSGWDDDNWAFNTCSYTPSSYCIGPEIDNTPGPETASGLTGAEERILARGLRGVRGQALRWLYESSGLDHGDLEMLRQLFFNPVEFTMDDTERLEHRRKEFFERTGRFIEFVDCGGVGPNELRRVADELRGKEHRFPSSRADSRTEALRRIEKARTVEVCL
ncbi:MAG: hypothetical protein AAGF92_14950 [Myxococcota bacterium]